MSYNRILVTGGAGFIGSHLVDELVKEGFEVTVFDDLSTGRIENIRHHLEKGKIRFIEGDVCGRKDVEEALEGVEVVFHLAAITSVPYSIRHPKVTYEVNVDGTRNLLEACLHGNVERFIYVSSCAVYGEPEYLPIDEGHPTNPISPYAESKLRAEELCMKFHEDYGLKTTILRLFNVYGPRMRGGQYGGVIMSFFERLMIGEPPVIYGDGGQSRDFVHVLDVVSAAMLAFRSDRAVGEVFNVGSGVAVSIADLASLVMELFGVKGVEPIYMPARIGDVRYSCADIGKLRMLGYEPRFHIRNGLSSLLRCLRLKRMSCRLE